MGGLSIWHWIIVGVVAFVVFGGKFKISDVMGDVAKGIKAFKKGMAEEETPPAAPVEPPKNLERRNLEHQDLERQASEHLGKSVDSNKV